MSGHPASGHVPVRGGSHLRRGPSVRRASARVSLTRVGAAVVLLAVSFGLLELTGPEAFAVRSVEVDGAQLTDRAEVSAVILEGGLGNVFRYDTAAAALRVSRLPAVLHVDVSAVLPDRIVASIEERTAVLRWVAGTATFLVDDQGLLFASVDRGADSGAGPAAGGDTLAEVIDRRAASANLAVGARLSAVDVRVARQLGALTPAMVGSRASALAIAVDDQQGFLVTAGWTAVFGVYGEVTRSPDLVSLQVQCLASLLADRGESAVGHVILSPEGQLCGTYGAP